MNVNEHATSIMASAEVQKSADEGFGTVLIVSSMTPAVGGGTAVSGYPRVTEPQLLVMLRRLVQEMERNARAARLAQAKGRH